MNKVFKKITACTLAGAIVAGSFGGYSQVNTKETDTDVLIEKDYEVVANWKFRRCIMILQVMEHQLQELLL